MTDFSTLTASVPYLAPGAALAWEALVHIGARQSLGTSPLGERYLIPILGGQFKGSLDGHTLQGKVMPGGADRQLWRSDGARELDALYEMQHDDGAVFTIHNQVLIHESPEQGRYAFSHVRVSAPAGPHAWLNHRMFVGTLHPMPASAAAVLIRVWQLK